MRATSVAAMALVAVAMVTTLVAGCDRSDGEALSPVGSAETRTPAVSGTDIARGVTDTLGRGAPADTVADVVAAEGDAASTVGVSNALVGEGVRETWPAARFAAAGLVPATPQRAGDPARGRQALVEEGYVACGLPARVVRELVAGTPLTTLPDREPAAAGLPFSMNVSTDAAGVEIASSNCLTCHGTPLFGELVVGLGNEFLDFTENPSAAVERAGALVRGPAESAAWERYADRVHAIAPYMTMATVGTNPANNLTFALIAHRDAATNAWSDEPLLPLPTTAPPPVSVPPWWRMAKKHAMFNLGEGRDDHARLMMSAAMLCTDTIEELEAIDAYAPDIRAYLASLEPPAWPFEVDAALAATGRDVFEANCSLCHGRYAHDGDGRRVPDEDAYPNRLVPIDVVGTDPTLVEHAHGDGVPYIDWFNRSFYGRRATAAPGPGHVAPPLDGVWATGPFLHNGSVPSVRALLDSGSRPARWYAVATDASDPATYDTANLGWRFVADGVAIGTSDEASPVTSTEAAPAADRSAAAVPGAAPAASERSPGGEKIPEKRIYDTSRPGHANGGHRFGDHLTDAERSAVIEYLKTL